MGVRLGAGRGPRRRTPELARAGSTPRRQRQAGASSLTSSSPLRAGLDQMDESVLGPTLSPLEDHLSAPRGEGRLSDAPHFGTAGGAACGDAIRIAVAVDGDAVSEAGFEASGCAAARAAASATVELVRGASLLDAARITPVDNFVAEHAAGGTPNPCTRCNGLVRFGAMLELAGRLGAARLATGHYARVARHPSGPLLRCAADPAKDQSYMLARIRPADLERLDFPLGELRKPEVREIARGAGLPVADREESQDLCFLAGTDGAQVLRRHGSLRLRRGEILDLQGRVVGEQRGQHLFTVGQRRGLGVSGPSPLYVVHKEPRSGRVVVGPRAALATRRVDLASATLHMPSSEVDCVKLRYRSRAIPCRVEPDLPAGRHRRLAVELEEAVEGVAPGQVACLMCGG